MSERGQRLSSIHWRDGVALALLCILALVRNQPGLLEIGCANRRGNCVGAGVTRLTRRGRRIKAMSDGGNR